MSTASAARECLTDTTEAKDEFGRLLRQFGSARLRLRRIVNDYGISEETSK